MNAPAGSAPKAMELEEARRWIGRRLVLSKALLGFEAGTRCVIMCIVDFGDGLLLWVSTDDKRSLDVDQVSCKELEEYFEPLPPCVPPASPASGTRRLCQGQMAPERSALEGS